MRIKSLMLGVAVCLLGGLARRSSAVEAPEPSGGPPEAEFHMARLAYFARRLRGLARVGAIRGGPSTTRRPRRISCRPSSA